MCRKYSLILMLFAMLTCPLAGSLLARPVGNRIKTSFTLGPAILPMPGIRFQYRWNNYLSVNSGLSYFLAAGDFNTGIYFHLPPNSINPYSWYKKNIYLPLNWWVGFKCRCCRIWNRKLFCGSRNRIWTGKNRFWQYSNRVSNHPDRLAFLIDLSVG